jgi:TPR repeat protein
MHRGAERDDVSTMYNLGLIKEAGDRQESKLCLRRGAGGSDDAAVYNLGMLLKEGYGDDATIWLERGSAVRAGTPNAPRK